MYDVIIVGARVAGASTAMLLARQGLKVLVLDQAAFPSDTLSTHQVQLPGVARLRRWGVLDRIVAAGTPATRRLRFDGPAVLVGDFPTFEGVNALYSPRRTLLDSILVDAARAAGAEVRERFIVQEVVVEGGCAAGVKGHQKGGTTVCERARLVVGADGKHSLVAESMKAPRYLEEPSRTIGCYTYWEGVPAADGEIISRTRRLVGAWPTNDGLLMTFVAWPIQEASAFRGDVEGSFMRTVDLAGDLGERVRAGRRAERFRATLDLPNLFRKPYGPGWALVGDAGLVMDPASGQGISDALRDAELLSDAIHAGLGGPKPLPDALADYERARNRAALAMYRFTTGLVSFREPQPEEELLMRALVGRPDEITRFLGVLTGAVRMEEFFSPRNMVRLIGVRGMARAALGRMRAGRRASSWRAEPARG